MSRGSRPWSFAFLSAATAATLIAWTISPAPAVAGMMTDDGRPLRPRIGRTGVVLPAASPASIAPAASRIANLAGKRRPAPPPAPKYGPWASAVCSWYWEPQPLAGGGYLKPGMMIVAHKSLPFGTRIQFSYHGRTCIATVMDRGPYVSGREFDLGPGTAKALGFDGVDRVSYRFIY